MISLVYFRLHLVQINRIAHMGPEAVGHLLQGLVHPREYAGEGVYYRIGRVSHIKVKVSGIGITGYFNRIAQIIVAHAVKRLGIGIAVAGGIGVQYPEQFSLVVNYYIGITVKAEIRSNFLSTLKNIAVHQYLAVVIYLSRKRHLVIFENPAEDQPATERIDLKSIFSFIIGIYVSISGRIIEFFLLGVNNHIIVSALAEIYLGTFYLQGSTKAGRNVLDKEIGETFLSHFIDRAGHHAVTMGVHQFLIDPGFGLRIEIILFQLPGRYHYLAVLTINHIAVNIHIIKNIIGSQFLQAFISIGQRLPVPETYVGNGILIIGVVNFKIKVYIKFAVLNLIQAISLAGILDVSFNIGPLPVKFVRLHHQLLQQSRIYSVHDYRHYYPGSDAYEYPVQLFNKDISQYHCSHQQGNNQENLIGQQFGMNIGIGCSIYDAGR